MITKYIAENKAKVILKNQTIFLSAPMKKLLSFYFLILLPIPVICAVYKIGAPIFCLILIILYVIIYRPVIHGLRLRELGLISNKEFWLLFIPFYSTKYFHNLYFQTS